MHFDSKDERWSVNNHRSDLLFFFHFFSKLTYMTKKHLKNKNPLTWSISFTIVFICFFVCVFVAYHVFLFFNRINRIIYQIDLNPNLSIKVLFPLSMVIIMNRSLKPLDLFQ